jgi:hypothetical protein
MEIFEAERMSLTMVEEIIQILIIIQQLVQTAQIQKLSL